MEVLCSIMLGLCKIWVVLFIYLFMLQVLSIYCDFNFLMGFLSVHLSRHLHIYLFSVPFCGLFSFSIFFILFQTVFLFHANFLNLIIIPYIWFLMRDRKGVPLYGRRGGEELCGLEGGDIIINMSNNIYSIKYKILQHLHSV